MKCEFVLNQFEGPLDLLLHLIKKDNIDIYDINLESLTNQYLEYINQFEDLNLDIASEYLVMAAELLEMKSRALLPKSELETEDEYEEDPKEQLIKRLIDYKQYKEVTERLKDLEQNRGEIFTKIPESLVEYVDNKEVIAKYNLTVEDLLLAFNQFLNRKELEKPLKMTVTKKEDSIVERTREIKEMLKTKKKVKFSELFEERTKGSVIITFLSLLELAKTQEIKLVQENNFMDIFVSLGDVK